MKRSAGLGARQRAPRLITLDKPSIIMSKPKKNDESIYALIPPTVEEKAKPPRYVSKYPADTAPTASTFGAASKAATFIHNAGGHYEEPPTSHTVRQAMGSFGTATRTLETHKPSNFTMRHQNEPRLPSRASLCRCFSLSHRHSPSSITLFFSPFLLWQRPNSPIAMRTIANRQWCRAMRSRFAV